MSRLVTFPAFMRIAWGLLSLLVASASADAAISKRWALVIANTDYVNTSRLNNPANDANLVAAKLKELGFQVVLQKNLDARRFSEVIHELSSHIDKDTDVLFYYAGHGLQFRGENYLVGIDASLKSEATLQFETFRLNTVLNLLEQRAGTTLIFWDACRNNPLARELTRSIAHSDSPTESIAVRGGAAPVPPRRGDTLVVFSAEPGKLALDGRGELSPFAEALGRHIATANLEIEVMLKRVTADVLNATKRFQRPERLSQLTQEFYFRREGVAELTYEEEVKKLRKEIEQLKQREPVVRKRFNIVGSDKLSKAPGPRNTETRGADPSTEESKPEVVRAANTPSSDARPNVVISVNMAASTIVRKIKLSPNGKLLALAGDDGIVRIVNLATFEVVRAIHAHSGRISDLDFSPDNRTLLSAGREGAIRFWDVETGAKKKELRKAGSIPYSARLNSAAPDRFVLMGDRAGRLVAWNLRRNNHIITNAKFHNGPVLSVAYQPHRLGTFLSAGGDGFLKIRYPEGKRVSLHAHDGPIFQAGYSSSGSLLYTVGMDRKIKIWDASKPGNVRPKSVLEGHLKYVISADMSADEKMLVSGGADKALNLWNLASSKLIGRMQGHTADVEAVAFTPDGRFLVSASEDKSVRIWSVENQEELVRMMFKKGSDKYAGVTFENQSFGDRDSGLISVYINGREAPEQESNRVLTYIGRRIGIIESE
jgi:hypothetical protein